MTLALSISPDSHGHQRSNQTPQASCLINCASTKNDKRHTISRISLLSRKTNLIRSRSYLEGFRIFQAGHDVVAEICQPIASVKVCSSRVARRRMDHKLLTWSPIRWGQTASASLWSSRKLLKSTQCSRKCSKSATHFKAVINLLNNDIKMSLG